MELRLQPTTAPADTAQLTHSAPAQKEAAPVRGHHRTVLRLGYAKALPKYDYEHYSRLAGPLTQLPTDRPYRVRYRSLLAQEPHRVRAALMLGAAPLLSFTVLLWILQPDHWASALQSQGSARDLRITMIVTLGLIECSRLLSVLSGALSTLTARDPIPVVPETGTKVAFLTTFVPGKEPLDMVRATLEAAVRLRHRGLLHVWLLDEGNDSEARLLCERLGVHHFSRKGVKRWNQRKGPHRARTKHGNYNAWLAAHGDEYEFFASVDTDHIPLPNYLERMLGYFRDPNVAFVVGPQVYGNSDSWISRAAESQQFLFHALTQRAGNRYGVPMLVGTNNAIRIEALKEIGGVRDSITEDLATGLDIHRGRNPATGDRWRSVYTPDVLAVGEGPTNWTDFFTQQLRWSRGTCETIIKQLPGALFSFSPGRLLHYSLTLAYYPMTALNWALSALSCLMFVVVGTGGVDIDPVVWFMLYGNASALQIGLYIWNRRHNVSPHEPEGSGGVVGMMMSALTAPIYVRAALDTLLRRRSLFVVTPKGDSATPDTFFGTFRHHLPFAVLFMTSAVYGFGFTQARAAGVVGGIWSVAGLVWSILPPTQWLIARRRAAHEVRAYGTVSSSGTFSLSHSKVSESASRRSSNSSPVGVDAEAARHRRAKDRF
ncbi:glycosyltransferase family 2 protein [Streptomyces sp. SAS_270]|uniref:glycosyltransferase family 2 protein n=1 Tax=Streptomyces sp. SAS_270 TaxID=3412748 RepID=UPI00403C2344